MEISKLKRQEMLISFIEEMAQNPLDDDFDYEIYIESLSKIYLDDKDQQTFRHSYAYITERIYEMDADSIALCIDNIDKLISKIQNNLIKNPLEKLRDHIQLESLHISRMNSAKQVIESVPDLLQKASESMSKYNLFDATVGIMSHRITELDKDSKERSKQLDEESKIIEELNLKTKELSQKSEAISKEIKEYNAQMVTILGIFAGVVFAFSGGFSLIGGALANIHNIHGIQTLFFLASVLSIGLILYDVVYALLHFVGRYCDKEPKKIEGFTKLLNLICGITVILLLAAYLVFSLYHDKGLQQDLQENITTPYEATKIITTEEGVSLLMEGT